MGKLRITLDELQDMLEVGQGLRVLDGKTGKVLARRYDRKRHQSLTDMEVLSLDARLCVDPPSYSRQDTAYAELVVHVAPQDPEDPDCPIRQTEDPLGRKVTLRQLQGLMIDRLRVTDIMGGKKAYSEAWAPELFGKDSALGLLADAPVTHGTIRATVVVKNSAVRSVYAKAVVCVSIWEGHYREACEKAEELAQAGKKK